MTDINCLWTTNKKLLKFVVKSRLVLVSVIMFVTRLLSAPASIFLFTPLLSLVPLLYSGQDCSGSDSLGDKQETFIQVPCLL